LLGIFGQAHADSAAITATAATVAQMPGRSLAR
jgi:hypothetical protein